MYLYDSTSGKWKMGLEDVVFDGARFGFAGSQGIAFVDEAKIDSWKEVRMAMRRATGVQPSMASMRPSIDWIEYGVPVLLNYARRVAGPEPVALPTGSFVTLYRYFNANGRLLYVGITEQRRGRAEQHVDASPWWPAVASATFEHFATRSDAEAAEKIAIRTEAPVHNKVHSIAREALA